MINQPKKGAAEGKNSITKVDSARRPNTSLKLFNTRKAGAFSL
jgi:hypothetical protein